MAKNNPLWMPKGSVRAIIALLLVVTICLLVLWPLKSGQAVEVSTEIVATVSALAGAVIGYYFKAREVGDEPDNNTS
jgi:hypothetical protein